MSLPKTLGLWKREARFFTFTKHCARFSHNPSKIPLEAIRYFKIITISRSKNRISIIFFVANMYFVNRTHIKWICIHKKNTQDIHELMLWIKICVFLNHKTTVLIQKAAFSSVYRGSTFMYSEKLAWKTVSPTYIKYFLNCHRIQILD